MLNFNRLEVEQRDVHQSSPEPAPGQCTAFRLLVRLAGDPPEEEGNPTVQYQEVDAW